MKFKPLADRVVVRRLAVSTEHGVVLPEKYAKEKDRCVVIAVGPGRPGVPMTLKVGDQVLLEKTASMQTQSIEEEDVLVLYEAEIAGIFA